MPLRPECSSSQRKAFHATVKSHQLDQSVLNIVSANVHSVLRGRSEIAASPQDCFYLNLPLLGQSTICQNGVSVTLRTGDVGISGDVGIFDSSEHFEIDHGTSGTLGVASLMFPKELLGDVPITVRRQGFWD